MSTSGIYPSRLTAFPRRLFILLMNDSRIRIPPPVSLPGRSAAVTLPVSTPPAPTPPPPSPVRERCGARHEPRHHEAEFGAAAGQWSVEQLRNMNARFALRMNRAYASGAERR
jgi:hypothetical protein